MSGTNQLSIIIFIGIVNKIKNIQVKMVPGHGIYLYIKHTFIFTYDEKCK